MRKKKENKMVAQYLLIIYPSTIDIRDYEKHFQNLLKNSVWLNGKEIVSENTAWNFLIIPKEKEFLVLSSLCLHCKMEIENIFKCDIDIFSLDNSLREKAMKRFFENYYFEESKLKERVEKVISSDMKEAIKNNVFYDSLMSLKPRLITTFNTICEKDITDNKMFSQSCKTQYILPIKNFNHPRPIRRS